MSNVAARAVDVIASTLPARVRERYREEWEADLAGASEAGISRGSVVVGAAVTAITIDRVSPESTGVSLGRAFAHRLSVAAGFGLAAALLLGCFQAYGGYRIPADRGHPGGEALATAATAIPAVAIGLGMLAACALIGAARVAVAGRQHVVALVTVLGFLAGLVVVALWAGALLLLVGMPAFVLIVVLAVVLTGRASGSQPASRRARRAAALGFPLVTLAVCAVGIAHVFVWNPLAAVPGMPLDQIYSSLAAAGEAPGTVAWIAVWTSVTVIAAAGYVVVAASRPRRRPDPSVRRLVALGCLLVAGTTLVGFVPAFSMGMGIADTFMTSGGDFAVTGPLLAITGQTAVAAAVVATFVRFAPLPQEQPAPS